ncbi:two-component sensor histidine kinase [Bacillus canaveralius]|uniref:histidine kinase n=1 Tax=Bacillus canaveralius TaxID=1403243 RepID=A0A2N5GLD3_9BACI|nr:ATP-binding protein [Bacillus canaveralius]PLR82453.1 two-component sensor histidine kinase [Bacillus canaveralius]PLR95624.1 two-component sensor histidine kinase [Bacillus canaveralius]
MDSYENVLEKLPFPYFYIEHNLLILMASKYAEMAFQAPYAFSELVMERDEEKLRSFLFECSNKTSLTIPMNHVDYGFITYTIYKVASEPGIHLFCFPTEAHTAEIQSLITTVERKLTFFHGQLAEKKQAFEKAIQEMHEAAIATSHITTVEKLAAGIAHEIRNPLTTVKGFIQLIKPYLNEIGKEEYANVALEEINRANDIIYEFLNAAKPKKNKTEYVYLNTIIREIFMLFESEAHLRNIRFTVEYDQRDALLHIDNKQLKQVLVNMVKNALEAVDELGSERQGDIQLITQVCSGCAFIIITDNGCGIAEQTAEKLFNPFYTTKETGTGIGLSVCKKIVESNGGKIYVESTVPQGATFKIALPVASELASI